MFLQMYLYPKSKEESNIFIDWGDGDMSSISKWTPSSSQYEYFTYYDDPYFYSELMISHTYTGNHVNRKNTIAIYGDELLDTA